MNKISIRGARTHNLKNIDLDLPRDSLIVITGLSGSGKSSLAFDTIYAEGQRRYVESLSAYARQFLSMMEKPDVDHIEGLSPAISIEQKSTSHNPRSTVATITEIYDYLRLLYARAGIPHCPKHNISLQAQAVSQMVDQVLAQEQDERWMLLAPVVNQRKGEHIQLLEGLRADGFIRARIDGEIYELDEPPTLDLKKKHSIEVIVDRFKIRDDIRLRLSESFETTLRIADGIAIAATMDGKNQLLFSERYACSQCGYSIAEMEPRIFSFNNPKGACPGCDGLGTKQSFDPNLVVHNADISLSGGAIRGWDRRNAYYHQIICSLADHYNFDIEAPFSQIPKDIQAIILYGSGKEKIVFKWVSSSVKKQTKTYPFEGIIVNMERRYHDTESQMVRDELAKYLSRKVCEQCNGSRLNIAARHVFINQKPLHKITCLPIKQTLEFFNQLQLPGHRGEIAEKINKEIQQRLEFLVNVGLDYLTLDRSADTLSGGEAQRIRLASQIGAGLVGVMYVLDEPSIGLHQRDNQRLLNTLFRLRDLGNTVIVVEHDEDAILSAQHVIDIGPGAGIHGGEIVAEGTAEEIKNNPASLTGQYLSGKQKIKIPDTLTALNKKKLITIHNARGNNLQNVTVSFPIGLLTCVTGVSGSGKSTLINDTLYKNVARILNKASCIPAPCDEISGLNHIDKVVDIDQSPIGRTPRSNPATYTGIFTPIRELFAATAEARSRGYTPGRFSFNVKGGRCESCKGDGVIKVEMHFLPDIFVSCDICQGKRYNRETLDVRYKGKSINEILEMTVEDSAEFFSPVPVLAKKLHTLIDVGLSYISLGQNAVTLSGGEAQRVKLAKELSKRDTGKTLYILDEPTTGLHFHDIKQLLSVLHTLRDHGNTIIIIEHNLDVIKTADWVIDMGPEGGAEGGMLVAEGTPAKVSTVKDSYTGHYLKRFF
ncbi:MAG: excinuclease ABC subunit UvrA [Methylococcales symbiont of Iophon sp. n. MRB-2018]|nr:MAG: excinuclease ABC subunit UvrA [Methylococcales symbiont of Iophon sp. n. MRB-2018]KAF3979923.1 MAG: excinuclease ABC subunit UvrA [Methylococcales symbiont of Iophon sp. n. MRB-2018]